MPGFSNIYWICWTFAPFTQTWQHFLDRNFDRVLRNLFDHCCWDGGPEQVAKRVFRSAQSIQARIRGRLSRKKSQQIKTSVWTGVERCTDCRATVSFKSLQIRIRSEFRKIYQNSSEILKLILEAISAFSRIYREIPRNFHLNQCKNRWNILLEK